MLKQIVSQLEHICLKLGFKNDYTLAVSNFTRQFVPQKWAGAGKSAITIKIWGHRACKASFIDIRSIASFKPFLIAWLRQYCTFSDSSVVNLKSSRWPKYTQFQNSSKKNHVLLSNFFSSSNMFFITLFLANT